jgi:hypothetical protein
MVDAAGAVTTGLLKGLRYIKDNRLLPRGFDKTTADRNIAVIGEALQDADFADGSDKVRYSVDVSGTEGPYRIDAEMRFQVISFRWAENLKSYDSDETRRFTRYYDSMSSASSEVLAHTSFVTQ